MAVESEIIDARVGEPHVKPEQIADVDIGTYGPDDYVLSTGNQLKAELITNNSVRVFDGVMVYGGLRDAVPINKYYDMTIENGAQGKNRNDIIVRRYTKEEGASGKARSEFVVIKGTAVEGEAFDPEIAFTDIRAGALTHDMPLHRVRIEGLNIVAVEPMFDVLTSMAEHQKMLADLNSKLPFEKIEVGNIAARYDSNTWLKAEVELKNSYSNEAKIFVSMLYRPGTPIISDNNPTLSASVNGNTLTIRVSGSFVSGHSIAVSYAILE